MPDVDVCVVGGGIQGCGVAQAAAAAGYRTVVLEQTGLASATSQRSSKLIHGGLRYLETGQFALVAKSLRERERLLRNAPDLVQRVPFYIPVYTHTRRRPWQIALGLGLYALLGRLRAGTEYHRIPGNQWSSLDGLQQEGLQAVYQYWDARTDDFQLTRAVMHSAMQMGAQLLCPARFVAAVRDSDHYQVEYRHGPERKYLECRVLINAAGPWIKQVHDNLATRVRLPALELVQGTHLVLAQAAPSGVYYVESPSDGRAVFIMPWQGQTLIGTTETVVTGDPAEVQPTAQEVEYLRDVARLYFPHHDDSVVQQFAGVRVLLKNDRSVFRRPRDTLLFTHPDLPAYVALVGGKLTAYRMTAEMVIREVRKCLGARHVITDTRDLKLARVDETC